MERFPAVSVLGSRQVGKTTLVRESRPDWTYLDLENPADFDRLATDPLFFFERHQRNVIIDEAQRMPELFPILRGVIDEHRAEKGRFILTGSSSPALLDAISESLAGRIGFLQLEPLKASELVGLPLSPLYDLLTNPIDREAWEPSFPHPAPLPDTAIDDAWLSGGYPEPRSASDPGFWAEWMAGYQRTYIERDIAVLFPRLDRYAYRRFIGMLATVSGTVLNRADVARSLEVSHNTVRHYLEIADGTFVWRNLESFDRNVTHATIKMPRGYLRDSGLRHFLRRTSSHDLLDQDPGMGASFESFVIEELIRGAELAGLPGCTWNYYRTRGGAEIDLIAAGPFGLLPIEVKHGSTPARRQLRSLTTFVREHELPMGLLINRASRAEWLTREIFQLPAGWL